MDFSSDLVSALQEHRLVHAYGPSPSSIALRILNAAQTSSNRPTFLAFRTNSEASSRYAIHVHFEGDSPDVGLAVGDTPLHANPQYDIYSNRVIYCTTGKLRTILLEQLRRQSMLPFGWIIIESWDKYDANAYAVAGLARQHTTAPITLVSYSKWSHLPYNDSTSVFEANKDIDVSYVKTSISSLASTISEESMYYGREGDFAPLRVRGGVYQPTLAYNSKIHIVVDTLRDTKGRPISKHTSDMRLGSISSGLVYRLGTEAEFAALKDRDPLRVDSSLDEAVIRLKHADLDVYSVLGNNHPQDEIKKILATIEKSGLANKDLDTVIRLRMGISSGLFYVSWTGRGRTSERDRYIAGLIGALIEHPPTYYAPIAAFKPFVGRNDIETLCNVWASLILSHSGPFWSWKREAHISFWCKDNGFNLPAIQKLITNMKRVCLGMKGDIGLFDNIKTQELNIATEVLVEIDRSRQKTNIKWDRSSALPAQSLIHNADILPVLAHGKTLDIYIDKRRLFIKTAIKAESLDLFYGL